jgi:uncharacterized membrane protein YgcG
MPDETPAPTDQQPAAQPAFNADALRAHISEAVRGTIGEMQQQAQAQQQQAIRQQQSQQRFAGDPVAQAIAPVVGPAMQAIALQAQSAMDKADFYLSHPEAIKHKDAIEGMFNQMAQQGVPFDRDSIFKYYKGANFDQFVQEHEQTRQAQSNQHVVAGAPGMARPQGTGFENFEALSLDDQRKRLSGLTF